MYESLIPGNNSGSFPKQLSVKIDSLGLIVVTSVTPTFQLRTSEIFYKNKLIVTLKLRIEEFKAKICKRHYDHIFWAFSIVFIVHLIMLNKRNYILASFLKQGSVQVTTLELTCTNLPTLSPNHFILTSMVPTFSSFSFLNRVTQEIIWHGRRHCTMSASKFVMNAIVNAGVFVGGAAAGFYVASNSEILKSNLSALFEPPTHPVEEEEKGCPPFPDEDEDDDYWSAVVWRLNKSFSSLGLRALIFGSGGVIGESGVCWGWRSFYLVSIRWVNGGINLDRWRAFEMWLRAERFNSGKNGFGLGYLLTRTGTHLGRFILSWKWCAQIKTKQNH